jgi:hypothetical protein
MNRDQQIVYYDDDGLKTKNVIKNKWADLPDGISDVNSVTDNDNRSAFNKTKTGSEANLNNTGSGDKPKSTMSNGGFDQQHMALMMK